MCEKVTRPCIKAVTRSLAIALVEMAKLVSNLITLVFSLVLVSIVSLVEGTKTRKMKVIRKPR